MDTILSYIAVLVISALVLLLVGLVVAYLRLVGKTMELKEERKKESGLPVVEQAQVKAQKMVEDARVKAQQIINNAQIFSGNQANVLEKEVQNANRTNSAKFEESLRLVQNETIKMLSSVPKDVSAALSTQLVNIRATIQTEIEKASSAAKAQVDNAYKKAEEEVQNYKVQRLKQIDDSIITILEDVSRKVLAKQISHDEHEKLVMKALEEAKEQHVFFEEQEEGGIAQEEEKKTAQVQA
jgi:tetrahydromethanopterin S-methyltransferase subunit F